MSEELIIQNCSPTLAGIKTGSLFSVRITEDMDICKEVGKLNDELGKKGLRIVSLKRTAEFALIYMYRPNFLRKDFKDPQALNILKSRGYDCENPESCIVQLVEHLKKDDSFPHEIGLFLGYPPSDVKGFIEDHNKGVKCCGCWKAYSEPEKAKNTFIRFRKCTENYREMNKRGKSLAQLAVVTG